MCLEEIGHKIVDNYCVRNAEERKTNSDEQVRTWYVTL